MTQPIPEAREPVPDGVRAQILATEHWGLLAVRSQTWNEVIGRISAQLTFASASLVLALWMLHGRGNFRASTDPRWVRFPACDEVS